MEPLQIIAVGHPFTQASWSSKGVYVLKDHIYFKSKVFLKPLLYQQMSPRAYTETQPKAPNSKHCRCRNRCIYIEIGFAQISGY
jgi:hypothetical protein